MPAFRYRMEILDERVTVAAKERDFEVAMPREAASPVEPALNSNRDGAARPGPDPAG